MQGSGFSEVIAGLESELKSVRAANQQLADDNRGCYAQIRAKDKELDLAAAKVEEARRIAMENKVRLRKTVNPLIKLVYSSRTLRPLVPCKLDCLSPMCPVQRLNISMDDENNTKKSQSL